MAYRRPAVSRSLRLMFALALLVLGIGLPLISAALSPAAPISAAGTLPTAHVVAPTPHPKVVAQVQGPIIRQQPISGHEPVNSSTELSASPAAAGPGEDAGSAAPATVVPSAAPTSMAAAHAEPTLTSTPVPLAPVQPGGVATLMPTWPAQGGDAAPAQAAGSVPPILMYHYVRAVDQASDPLGYELSVTPDNFERQMAWLRDQGYAGVRMDVVARCLRGETPCPARAVALTFDDGYADAYSEVLPVLQRYGHSATFYIVSGFVGQPGYMTWEQVAALRDAGMEIGAHTVSHPDLTSLDWGTAGYEIAQSKADLEQHLGISVTSFCYPTGLYNPAIEEQVRASGFLNATTTRWDSDTSDIMALPRRRVSGATALDGFVGIVQG